MPTKASFKQHCIVALKMQSVQPMTTLTLINWARDLFCHHHTLETHGTCSRTSRILLPWCASTRRLTSSSLKPVTLNGSRSSENFSLARLPQIVQIWCLEYSHSSGRLLQITFTKMSEAVAYMYTIEFQKQGLPHMHMLIFLAHLFKLLTPNDINSAISVKWPDPVTQPQLFDTVRKCMVHGPCGAMNWSAPCMVDGKCSKGFLKPYQPFMVLSKDGYPKYAQPNDGHTYEVKGHLLDNHWIVPHNPWSLSQFDCHINTECAVSFASVKYINKYVHKGPDCATMEVHDEWDEIKQFTDACYVSAPEGVWRMLENPLHKQEPNIVRLQVHPLGQH